MVSCYSNRHSTTGVVERGKVEKYTLVTNKLVTAYFFGKDSFLNKKIFYNKNKEKVTCLITYDKKEMKAIEECNNGEKTISYYDDYQGNIYKQLFYKNEKYLGKNIKNWEEGTFVRYNSDNKIIYKTDVST